MKRIFYLFLYIFSSNLVYSQRDNATKLIQVLPNLNFEKDCIDREEIKRKYKNQVTVMFFQDISDTVSLFINGKLAFHKFIFHDSDLVSTKYTGINFSHQYKAKNNLVKVKYYNSNRFIEFKLDKSYPLYSIQYYTLDSFTVSARKCSMVLK